MIDGPYPLEIPKAIAHAVRHMEDAGVANPARDARIFLARAINQPIDRLTLFLRDTLSVAQLQKFTADVQRRVNREPVSLITGRKEFYGRSFAVGPAVLTPRPETEFLIELALAEPFERVLDLGLGSGCILFTLLLEQRTPAWGLGTEVSPGALKVALRNRDAFALADKANICLGNWYDGIDDALPEGFPGFDLIVSNP
ncbi:MAG: peptide chain release factor N(5)-glutamine methyltransferase, partial [Boseongicola sp.]